MTDPAPIGHNSSAGDTLKRFVDRIEDIEVLRKEQADDLKDLYAEAKGAGFDTKILRKIIRIRKMDKAKREEEEALTETYLHALGMI